MVHTKTSHRRHFIAGPSCRSVQCCSSILSAISLSLSVQLTRLVCHLRFFLAHSLQPFTCCQSDFSRIAFNLYLYCLLPIVQRLSHDLFSSLFLCFVLRHAALGCATFPISRRCVCFLLPCFTCLSLPFTGEIAINFIEFRGLREENNTIST